MGGVP
jgi:hypothetical protein